MFTKTFKQLTMKDVNQAGGKGASLGEMYQAKILVPLGFVLLASAFDRFLEETDLNVEIDAAIDEVDHKDVSSVEQASVKIRDLIRDARFPEDIAKEIQKEFKELGAEYVAVRSSATAEDSKIASWAGELESYMNVTENNLLEAVKKCWSSLFTPRAIFYRFEKNLKDKYVSVAVVVQKMVQSEIAGICFTVHPITEDKNQMVIEAGWGLGDAIVSGSITPDTYVVDKQDFSMIDINVSEQEKKIVKSKQDDKMQKEWQWQDIPQDQRGKQKLTGKQIVELAKACLNIEKHYKFPCDIEWAFEDKRFYITQSRPITTLGK